MKEESTVRLAELPDALTVAEVARILRIGRNAAYEAVRRKEIPSIRRGRRLLVPKHALERLLDQAGMENGSESQETRPQKGRDPR